MSKLLKKWVSPKNYVGFNPINDFVLYAKHRGSCHLTLSNWYAIQEELLQCTPNSNKYSYTWKASCSMFGSIEYLMLSGDAPQEIKDTAARMLEALEDYPILDEEDFSAREFDLVVDLWAQSTLKERVELCQNASISIFAARHTKDMPSECFEELREWLY